MTSRLVRTFAVPYAAGHLAKKTFGNAPAVISGTLSILGESVRLAYMRGLQPSAFAAIAGRRILTGTPEFSIIANRPLFLLCDFGGVYIADRVRSWGWIS